MNISKPRQDKTKSNIYRPDVDGLRALAVTAVIAGHTFENWFPRGYLGVDAFFVISGFVITLSLVSRSGTSFGLFLAAFSLRRIKRLFPALLVCIGLTCAILLFVDPAPKKSLLTGAAALFGVSNFSLYFQELDYFSPSIRYNGFTHTWSLGVEEQFYLLFPLLFWVAFKPSQSRSSRRLLCVILPLCMLSLLGFVFFQTRAPMAAYYLMPLRFWELGLGVASAAFLYHRPDRFYTVGRFLRAPLLMAAMTVVFILPYGSAVLGHLLIVALTTALLFAGGKETDQTQLLTNRPTRYVGNISYSLYLWHWPFLTFGLLAPSSIWANPLVSIGSALFVAILSYHFVEQPVQRIKTPRPRLWHFAGAFASVFCVIAVVAAGNSYRKSVWVSRFEAAMHPDFSPLPGSNLPFYPTCVVGDSIPLKPDTFDKCTFAPQTDGERTFWVMGDSHAGHLQGTFLKMRDDHGYGFHLVETPGMSFPVVETESFPARSTLFQQVRDRWKPGDIVVLSRLHFTRTDPLRVRETFNRWVKEVDTLADELAGSGIGLFLVGPPPMFMFEDIRACAPDDELSCSLQRGKLEEVVDVVHRDLGRIARKHENTEFIDLFSELCAETSDVCSPIQDGYFLFRDRDHLNVEGAARMSGRFQAAVEALN
ncbi:O-acetyltransferase OatA (plasmid) [Sulfitobacter indolifex]|uniref:Acyltransferase n=1 Tax=Sulfitobacter indolifex HEL-45 TaxID=391624 RepID=A0ABM9X182_9RHOB|nr:acyltransferase family protein [Sulfitobacter indolifex]EDQ03241.1 putative acyltransferase [Sulfitobacter indolifex HEL-45]UOA20774.1 O-acetyltransferase OatA [Sulfitobacter indolifex]